MRSKAVWLDSAVTSQYSDFEYLMYTICYHAAPTIAGEKSATLLSFTPSGRKMSQIWLRYRHLVSDILPVEMLEVRRVKHCVTVLFFNRHLIEERLEEPEVSYFLKAYGYEGNMSTDQALMRLRHRFAKGCPHEIGIFLGYPLEDVKAFVANPCQECLMVGYWKVFYDAVTAERIFRLYDSLRHSVLDALRTGVSPLEVAVGL